MYTTKYETTRTLYVLQEMCVRKLKIALQVGFTAGLQNNAMLRFKDHHFWDVFRGHISGKRRKRNISFPLN